jgi:hypothetical protein
MIKLAVTEMNIIKQKRGQFIIIAVLMVAIMIVTIGAIMYSAVTYFRYERWEEYLMIIDNVKMGSHQLMEIGLANFTKTCFEKHADDRSVFNKILDQWKNDLRESLPGTGLAVDFLNRSQLLSSPKLVGGTYIPERQVYDFVKCYWYYPASVSSAYAELSINLSKSGLYGYRVPILIYLAVELDLEYLDQNPTQIDNINMIVTREYQRPVVGLTPNNFLVYRFDPSVDDWVLVGISKVTQSLGGKYKLTFEEGIEKPYYEWLIVAVKDDRNITVVSATYSKIEFIVEKNTPTGERPADTSDEIYTLEASINGTWYWNGKQLEVEDPAVLPPPIPPIPIKQFRVNVTENGVNSTSATSPCQYEIWDKINWHERYIEVPRDLADPNYPFNSTNRIVFQVKFPELNIIRQKVTIWWRDDLDAEPYQGPSDLEYIQGAYVAKTNRYEVEFIGVGHTQSPDYPYDYYGVAALVMKDPTTGLCFGPWNLHAFGVHGGALAEWRPYGQWQIKYWYGETEAKATVRLIAVLNSTEVQCVYDSNHHSSNYYDTYAVVFITANVKYLQQRVCIYWKQNQTDNGLWFASVMGKGEPKWFAYLNNQTGQVYNDEYDYLPWWQDPTHEEYEYPGYWGAHWNEQFGRGLIINLEGLANLRSFDANRTRFSITEAAPGGANQGSIEFEAVSCTGDAYTAVAGTSYSYVWAMWIYDGGNQTEGYKEMDYYHWMFLEPYAPKIVVEGG